VVHGFSPSVAELNSGPAHSQSQASGRYPGAVDFAPATLSNSNFEPGAGTSLTNKNGILKFGNVPIEKPYASGV
jgi:hypothetical protein